MTRRVVTQFGRLRVALTALVVLTVANGCTTSPDADTSPSTGDPESRGGTLYVLTSRDNLSSLDPQRVNAPVDRALLGDFVHRTLVRYAQDTDLAAQSSVVPDLASDTGTPNTDFTTWSFTLRDDVRWADGAPVLCEDVKYGVSRQFAREALVGGTGLAVDLLDIPTGPDGGSIYEGPYSQKGVEHFDRAVSCEGRRIVFSLAAPLADFPEALTHLEFSPVRANLDTGDRYELEPLPSGPYEVGEYTPGRLLVLRRSATWQPSTDPLRPAYPDRVVVRFSLPPEEIARRVVADSGNDRFAVVMDDADMAAVAGSALDEPERSWHEPTQVVTYLSVNSRRLPLVEHRRAIIAATDRVAAAMALGDTRAGDPADGLIAPGLALDYKPTGLTDGLIGEPLAATGDPALAGRLLAESGRDLPELIIDYPEVDVAVAQIEAVVTSLAAAGIEVEPNPLAPTDYYQYVLDPQRRGHLSWLPWRPDWANATRVVPPLFGAGEPFNLSGFNERGGVEDEDLAAAIEQARTEANRQDQAAAMQAANSRIVELGLAVPLAFGEDRRMWGSGLTNVFYHAPVGTYAFAQIVSSNP